MPWRELRLSKKEMADYNATRSGRRTKFLVDESVGPGVASLLKAWGWNAKGVDELSLNGRSDSEVFAAARDLNRILLTHDHDFLNNRRFPPKLNPGLVILPGADGNDRAILSALRDVVAVLGMDPEMWSQTKVVISDDRVWTARAFQQHTGKIVVNRYRMGQRSDIWADSGDPGEVLTLGEFHRLRDEGAG